MESKIRLYRIILNILFYIFYVLLVSIVFSFIFPIILVLFWNNVLDPASPIFDGIQIWIIIFVLVLSVIYRKYFFLPIRESISIKVPLQEKTNTKKIIKKDIINEVVNNEEVQKSKKTELDIKIGKEIK